MNTNETVRELTFQRAESLSAVARIISEVEEFENFTLVYYNYDIVAVFDKWVELGGQYYEMIEPTDGFHPSQNGQSMAGEFLYEYLRANFPDALGDDNPYNDQIVEIFEMEQVVNDCASDPCENGHCYDFTGSNNFTCECYTGYQGETCSRGMDLFAMFYF
jgi:acyloxyacyl hydrolase